MSKSILIIDTPRNCKACSCHYINMIGIAERGRRKIYSVEAIGNIFDNPKFLKRGGAQ